MESLQSMLANNRYLHLGTCQDDVPSVSLMNFTYVDGLVVLASPLDTIKTANIRANPNVSLLVHDLIDQEDGSLSGYLQKLNTKSLNGHKSASISGVAEIIEGEKAEEYRKKHLNTHPDAACFISQSAIVLVSLKKARIADDANRVETIELS